jgi:TIR domain
MREATPVYGKTDLSAQPVFISYSRKDYYFAESLAFHLLNRKVPVWLDVKDLKPGVDWQRDLEAAVAAASTVILVGSPGAFKSVNVRTECQHAVKLGKRIIVARRRGARLPDELKRGEMVDFQGGFEHGLDQLAASLTADPSNVPIANAVHRVSFVPRLPPWTATIAATLAIPLLGYFALVLGAGNREGGDYPFPVLVVLWLAVICLLLWFFLLGFIERRMGMTRLAVCLACLTVVYAYPLFRLFYWGPSSLGAYDAGIIRLIVDQWPIGALLGAVPLFGLVVLLFSRPEDLLRWSPTGKAWDRYRVGHAAKGSDEIFDAAAALTRVQHFRLFYDMPDKPAAARLREELMRAGAQEAQSDGAEATAVLLLTNRTRTLWLNQQADHLKGALLTVVASGIRLPETVGWLWRREWIDFRSWNINQPNRSNGLPRVPEAVTGARLPAPVLKAHHLLCAFAALLMAVGGAIQPPDSARSEILSVPEVVGAVCAAIGLFFALPARRLVRRRISPVQFARWTGPFAALAIASGLITLVYYCAINPGAWIRAVPASAFLLVAPILLRRLRPTIEFWLPPSDVKAEKQTDDSLALRRNWRTFGWVVLYLCVWALLLKDINQ